MTETDETRRPLTMPEKFIPYLDKYRIYNIFKDMMTDLVLNLPNDHLKHMKIFLARRTHSRKDADRIIILISPELKIDITKMVRAMIKDLGLFVITRRCVIDRYEKHEDYTPGCVSPALMADVTKALTMKDPVKQAGWLMYDHPCTAREARCLQQAGVLPTVTLLLLPPPPLAPPAHNPLTPARSFFEQDFEGLKFAYKATLKEVHVEVDDDVDKLSTKCFNAILAAVAGAQGPRQGLHARGAPSVCRALLLGPKGSGRRSHAAALAKHFGLVYLGFDDLLREATEKKDDVGEKLRNQGLSIQMKAEIVRRRILMKDCLDYGWVLCCFPTSAAEFEMLDNMSTPPNRIIILNVDAETCKQRAMSRRYDRCTGQPVPAGSSGPRVASHPLDIEQQLDIELDFYFSEVVAELRAAAGITAVEIDATKPIDAVQVAIQAAVMASPAFDIECCSQVRNVRNID